MTRSVWTLMSVSMYELWTRFLVVFYPGFQIKVSFSKRSGSNVTGQLRSQSRHCALTSHYFKLCPLHKSVLSQILLLFHFLQLYMFPHRELMKIFAWFTGSWCWCWRHCILGILSSLQAVYIKTDPEAAKWLDNSCRLTLY